MPLEIKAIFVMAAVTIFTRAFPFLLFDKPGKKVPEIVTYTGKYLPPAIIVIIVIYSYKDTAFFSYPYGIPEGIASLVVIITYWLKRNSLISIFAGTLLYMFLVQAVF